MATPFAFGPAPASVNFFQQAPETATDLNALQRQRLMAELLAKKGMEAPEGQMVSGHYVAPGAGSYVSQLVSALGGGMMSRDADAKEQSLAQALMTKRQKDSTDFMGALNGTPAQPGRDIQPLTPNDDEGNAMPVARSAGTAAVPGDVNKAISIAMQSQNPQIAGMAPELMKRQMDSAELQQVLQSAGIGAPPGTGGTAPMGGGASPAGMPPGVSPQALALVLSRNPQAQKLGGMIQDANKPMAIAEGGTAFIPGQGPVFTAPKTEAGINVQGGQAAPVPGFAEAQARRAGLAAGAEAAAKDPYASPITVPSASGPRLMMPAQVRQEAQGGVGNGGGPVNGQPVANPMAPRPGDTDRGMIYKQELDAAAVRMADAQKNGDQAAFARAQQDMGALMKEVQSNRIQLPQQPQQAAPGVGIALQSSADEKYQNTRAEDFAKRAGAIQSAGSSASGTMRNLDTLEQLFKDPNIAKGGAAESISSLKNLAASAGVDIKGAGAEQGIQAITNKMALDSRSTAEGGGMPGALSDADRAFLSNQQPGLSKTPEGRAIIIDNARKLAQRQVEVAKMAQRYEQQNGKIDAGFDRQLQEFADKNQMFSGGKKAASAPQALDFRALAAQELARRQKGGN